MLILRVHLRAVIVRSLFRRHRSLVLLSRWHLFFVVLLMILYRMTRLLKLFLWMIVRFSSFMLLGMVRLVLTVLRGLFVSILVMIHFTHILFRLRVLWLTRYLVLSSRVIFFVICRSKCLCYILFRLIDLFYHLLVLFFRLFWAYTKWEYFIQLLLFNDKSL